MALFRGIASRARRFSNGGAATPVRILLGFAGMPDVDSRQTTGRAGEALARAELEARGYEILATGFRTDYGEIDLVARDGGTLVFVEVRTRRTGERGTAAESVTVAKQWRVSRAASAYLVATGGFDQACRFDVVAIDYDDMGQPRVEVYVNAFDSRY